MSADLAQPPVQGPVPAAATGVALRLLNALPDATAVLDSAGVIVAVNRAWQMFCLDNGGSPDSTGVGVSYLDVCLRAAARGSADAAAVATGLAAVLSGGRLQSEFEYACPSPAVGRWYVLRMAHLAGDEPGALVAHVNVTRRKLAERELERQATVPPQPAAG